MTRQDFADLVTIRVMHGQVDVSLLAYIDKAPQLLHTAVRLVQVEWNLANGWEVDEGDSCEPRKGETDTTHITHHWLCLSLYYPFYLSLSLLPQDNKG